MSSLPRLRPVWFTAFPSAEALGYFRGRFPALGLVGARPVEQKKGADGGVDGKVFFRDHPDSKAKPQVIIFSVKGGNLKLDAGQLVTVDANVIGHTLHLTFGIPQGSVGATGANGVDGAPGQPGNPGPPGEVTNAALAAAIAGTSSNTNAVALLGLVVSDPPTQAEVQSLADKMDELIAALRR